jgi:hypothetical protein
VTPHEWHNLLVVLAFTGLAAAMIVVAGWMTGVEEDGDERDGDHSGLRSRSGEVFGGM